MTAMATKMLMGSRTTLRPVATARALRQSALLPSTNALRTATLASDVPPAWGFTSPSRSSYASTTTCEVLAVQNMKSSNGAHERALQCAA